MTSETRPKGSHLTLYVDLSRGGKPARLAVPASRSRLVSQLLHFPPLAEKCSYEALQQLVGASLEIITCPKLSKQGEGAAILAAVNKVTVRVLEKANHTNLVW